MCVLTTTLAASATAALAATLASSIGATAASITAGVVVGAGLAAVDGAVMGAATGGIGAAISGDDVGAGAVQGLWMGAATGAATGAVGGGVIQGLSEAGAYTTQASAAAHSVADSAEIAANSNALTGVGTTGEQVLDQGNEAAQMMSEIAKTGNVQPAAEVAGDVASGTASGATSAAGTSESASSSDLAKTATSAGMQIVGSGIEAYGDYVQGQDTATALEAQAKQQRIAAQSVLDSAEVEAKDLSRRQRQTIGKGRTAAAANGVMLESRAESSPAMWEQDAQAEAAWDREKLFFNANTKANALFAASNSYLEQASQARRTGNLKAVTSLIKGAVGAGTSVYGSLYA